MSVSERASEREREGARFNTLNIDWLYRDQAQSYIFIYIYNALTVQTSTALLRVILTPSRVNATERGRRFRRRWLWFHQKKLRRFQNKTPGADSRLSIRQKGNKWSSKTEKGQIKCWSLNLRWDMKPRGKRRRARWTFTPQLPRLIQIVTVTTVTVWLAPPARPALDKKTQFKRKRCFSVRSVLGVKRYSNNTLLPVW